MFKGIFKLPQKFFENRGVALVEVVISSVILSFVLVSFYGLAIVLYDSEQQTTHKVRANYLLLESIDVVRILRDESWSTNIATLTLDTPYYLLWNSGAWEITTTPNMIDGIYTRTVSVSSVNRDAQDDIAETGTLDPGSLKVTATVAWQSDGSTVSQIFDTYTTDLFQN